MANPKMEGDDDSGMNFGNVLGPKVTSQVVYGETPASEEGTVGHNSGADVGFAVRRANNNGAFTPKPQPDPQNNTTPNTVGGQAGDINARPDYQNEDGTLSEINLNDLVRSYENKLLKYHNPTWHFKLFALSIPDYVAYLNEPTENVQKYIIAESGVTGRYSINTVKIDNIAPATPGLTSNFSIYKSTMEIIENGGMKLTDDIIMMSNLLGYNKFADVPLVMELTFVGYDENTGQPMEIPDTERRWGVKILNINSQASRAGGQMIHTLTLVSNRTVTSNEHWALGEPFTCVSSNFGGFLDDFEEKLNNMAFDQYGYLSSMLPFTNNKFYEIICPESLREMMISYDSKQGAETTNTKSGTSGSKQYTWSAKVAFSRVVDDVLDSCNPLFGSDVSNASNRQFVHVVPYTEYVGYDPIRQTSAYKFYFYIIPYKVGDVLYDTDLMPERFNVEYFIENADKITDPDSNQPKLNIKRYDYQFTGLNNEIVSLDLKFDQQFLIAVTRNPQSQVDIENAAGTHKPNEVQLGGKIYDLDNPVSQGELWKRKRELNKKAESEEGLTQDESTELAGVDSAFERVEGKYPKTEGEDEQDGTASNKKDMSDTIYIEDFRDIYNLTETANNGVGNPKEFKTIPVNPENSDITNSGSTNDNSSSYEMDKRKTRDNYYNTAFLMKLDMKVVGDPYWLGWSDYSYMKYVRELCLDEQPEYLGEDFDYANYLTGEAYLLLNLRPPSSLSDETGLLDYTEPSVFAQSIYRVLKVTSEFSANGGFTQQLSGALNIRSLRKSNNEDGNYNNETNEE